MGLKRWLGIFGVLAAVGVSAAPALADECDRGVVVEQPVAWGNGYYRGERPYERGVRRRFDRDDWRFRRFEHRRFERNRFRRW